MAVLLVSACISSASNVCFSGSCVTVEVADTPAERRTGLMHRNSLPEDAGMLFVFDSPGRHGMWMKNTLTPLDMIWLDEEFTVVHIEEAVPCTLDPCPVYAPAADALYVLEVNRGYASEHGITVGDDAEFT